MNLINTTPFAADFFNTVVGEDRLLGSVVVRTVHRVEDGRLVAEPAREWPVTGDPYQTEFGDFDGEGPFVREGCDLFVLGHAYPADSRAVTAMVELRVGPSFRFTIAVFGDRTWVHRGPDLVPGEPRPFQRMPLTWEHAFGGTCKVDGLDLPWGANPKGRGFYWDAAQAAGQPLPNLEDPGKRIRAWSDRPDPVATAPYSREWELRILNSAEFDLDGPVPKIRRLKPALNNNALPRLILPQPPREGDVIAVTGVRPGGRRLEFQMPSLEYHVYVQLQDRGYVFPAQLEAVAVLAEEERVMLGYRCCFRYRMVLLERRAAVLSAGRAPAHPPAQYKIDWQEFDAKGGALV
jgi:hypothetical protein